MPRTAVLVVHGMGQQRPGATQRSLGAALARPEDTVYLAPDRITGRTDTRRVVIATPLGSEAHVYEHYWSDRFQDTRLSLVLPWMIRMLTSRGLGPRIGGRSAVVEWAVGIVAVLPYWLLLVASFALDEPRLGDFLDAVPAVGVVLALALAGWGFATRVAASRTGATLAGVVVGALGALLSPPFDPESAGVALVALGWAPLWLVVGAALRSMGPLAWVRILITVVGVMVLAFSAIEGRLVIGGIPGVITLLLVGAWGRHWLGDVARYLDPAAGNAGVADLLRRETTELVDRLCADRHYGYDSVVVVAHSQGGFVAFDALSRAFQAWAARHALDPEERAAAHELDHLIASGASPQEWAAAVDLLRRRMGATGDPWPVATFVTVGSPIAHAAGLLAKDSTALRGMASERGIATCPPAAHGEPPSIAYESSDGMRLHHSSVFAVTHWVNVAWVHDLLGGPVDGDGLGGLADDHSLGDDRYEPTILDFLRAFPHDAYWAARTEAFEPDVRRVVDLLRERCGLG